MRTDAEKRAFVKECLRIEKENGDVLGYIRDNWPSYSPRGTWYNLQRQYLERDTNHLTEGKPVPLPEDEGKEVNETMKKTRNSQEQTALAVVEAYQSGKSVRSCLINMGYSNIFSAMRNVKGWARKNRPDLAEILDCVRLGRPPVKHEDPAGKTADEVMPKNTGDHVSAEEYRKTVEFGGKTYEKLTPEKMVNPPWPEEMDKKISEVTAYLEKPSPTCCQPARPSGVTVPDELPEEPNPLKVAALLSSFDPEFRYELSKIRSKGEKICVVSLVWREPMSREERNLNLTAEEWRKFAEEIPRMLKQLGFE